MKKELILGICITAFVAIAAWAPNVLAFPDRTSCQDCHTITYGNTRHTNHMAAANSDPNIACNICHSNTAVANSCAQCHDAAPLQTNHQYVYEQTCNGSGCHNPSPPTPATETSCNDNVDNDLDGAIDCVDSDCNNVVIPNSDTTCGVGACAATGNLICQGGVAVDTCQPGRQGAEGPFDDANCSDTIDNNCDGLTDAADPLCDAPPEICNDGVDNNGNGLIDCAEPQCEGEFLQDTTCGDGACASTGSLICQSGGVFDTCDPLPSEAEGPFDAASCSDTIDNDCDGQTDAGDFDCTAPPEVCNDGADNNGNGLIDCADPQCNNFVITEVTTCGVGACEATGSIVCQNGGAVDTCQSGTPEVEGPFGDPSCGDTIDNNCNNQTDDTDSNCLPGSEICDDGIDNNDDGYVDCADSQCDGFVGQPGSCTTGLPGICSAGTTSCSGGVTICDQDTQAATEGPNASLTCNDTLDNDCDGDTDASDSGCDAPPVAVCGDGNLDAGEQCDDGNTDSGDGCSSICQDESVAPVCGNGTVEAGEACDDGNQIDGDGCSSTCQIESTAPSDDDEHDEYDEYDEHDEHDEYDDERDSRYERRRRWDSRRSYRDRD